MRYRIRKYVQRYLYEEHYQLLENVCLRSNDGEEILIPQVLVSRFGIFVMAFCDARGQIFGNNSISWWYDKKGAWYHPFDNPHTQMVGLEYLLSNFLQIPKSMCQTVVVFHERAKFNHSNYQQTGYLIDIFHYLTAQRLGYLAPEEFRAVLKKLEIGQQSITSDAKRCIIETGVIARRPA
ncbi:MAG: NERD domain-containing protein [Gammaproteobacteria bacterium]|nr:NERD domain-containing protein [Gammaproteobacteria bacterium]NNJ73091.1 NERD domain-containing protein [Enterobacterales bacterium]